MRVVCKRNHLYAVLEVQSTTGQKLQSLHKRIRRAQFSHAADLLSNWRGVRSICSPPTNDVRSLDSHRTTVQRSGLCSE